MILNGLTGLGRKTLRCEKLSDVDLGRFKSMSMLLRAYLMSRSSQLIRHLGTKVSDFYMSFFIIILLDKF